MKIKLSIAIVLFFLFLSYGSGSDEKKYVWKEDSKESFCGLKFTKTKTIKEIDMTKKIATELNCDGTYISREDWGTSEKSEEIYNKTVGKSSGNFGDFYGTWVIVDKVADEDYNKIANPRFNLPESNKENSTLIRYTSNLGKTRYAEIYLYENQLWLSPIPYNEDINDENSYEYEDLNMYDGSCYP